MPELNGTWVYQSFRPSMGPPSPILPWSPPAKLSATTDATGKVDGKLTIPLPAGAPVPALVFTISGSITPASTGTISVPEGVQLKGEATLGDGRVSVNELRGYFVPGGASAVIVGTIRAVKNDPLGEPDGTSGPFALFPARSTG